MDTESEDPDDLTTTQPMGPGEASLKKEMSEPLKLDIEGDVEPIVYEEVKDPDDPGLTQPMHERGTSLGTRQQMALRSDMSGSLFLVFF